MISTKLATKVNTPIAIGKPNTTVAAAIHGDINQQERTRVMFAFKNQNMPIMVATDVASRGLDVKSVKV